MNKLKIESLKDTKIVTHISLKLHKASKRKSGIVIIMAGYELTLFPAKQK